MDKRTISKIKSAAIFTLCSIMLFSSCVKEDLTDDGYPNSTDDPAMVSVVIKSPGTGSIPTTRALGSDAQENDVTDIDVLLFKPGGGLFQYHAIPSGTIENTGTNSQFKKFEIKLWRGTYDLVILANARDIVSSADFKDKTKAEALALLEKELPSGGKWPSDGSAPFPMWGEKENLPITDGMNISNAVQLLRMVARVDVLTESVKNKFQLRSVRVYNYNTRGTLVPKSTVDKGGSIQSDKPNVPSSSVMEVGSIVYNHAFGTDHEYTCVRDIYLLEALNPQNAYSEDRPCLVIGGVYDATGSGNFSGEITYYRVDYSEKDENDGSKQIYMDVVRNKWYQFNITGVSVNGYTDPDDAFRNPSNIMTEVVSWDENTVDVTWNEHNHLSVSQSRFEFHAGKSSQTLIIETDWEKGWKITDIPSWLEITPDQVSKDGTETVTLTPKTTYDSDIKLDDYFNIKAGTLEKRIYVTRDNTPDINIEITPSSTIQFYKSGGTRTVTITVSGDNPKLYFKDDNNGVIQWEQPGGFPSDGGGSGQYTFKANPLADAITTTQTANVTVFVRDDSGNERQATIYFQQLATKLPFEFKPWDQYQNGWYPAIGGNNLWFTAITARPWTYMRATVDDFTPDWPNANSQQTPNMDGKQYDFELGRNETWSFRNFDVWVKSEDSDIGEHKFTLTQDFVAPKLNITNKAISYDLGSNKEGKVEQKIEFYKNTAWAWSNPNSDDNGYEWIVGSVSHAAGTTHGNTVSPHDNKPATLTFTSKAFVDGNNQTIDLTGLPAAGESVSAKIKLYTMNHSPAAQVEQEIVLTRTIPAIFDFVSMTPATGPLTRSANISANVKTNDIWSVHATFSDGTSAVTNAETSKPKWDSRTLTLNNVNNNTWKERDVTVYCMWNNTKYGEGIYKQPGYYTTSGTVSGDPINGTGGNATVTITGDFPASSVNVKATLTNDANAAAIKTGTASASSSGGTVTLYIDPNAGGQRTIWFWYQDGASTTWKSAGSLTQVAVYNYSFSSDIGNTQYCSIEGGNYKLILSGFYPNLRLRAYSADINSTLWSTSVSTGTTQQTFTVTIPRRTHNKPIFIRLQYSEDNGITWNHLPINNGRNYTYQRDIRELQSGAYMATSYMTNLTWAEAMSVPTLYNTTLLGNKTVAKQNTGCNYYYEGSVSHAITGRGKWRAPTADEMYDMYTASHYFPWVIGNGPEFSNSTPGLWVATERDATTATWQWGAGLSSGNTNKTKKANVRCVRDK